MICPWVAPVFLGSFFLTPVSASAQTPSQALELKPVELENRFVPDRLSEDPLAPIRASRKGSALTSDAPNAKGTLTDPFSRDFALPVTTAGGAGSASQFRGLGRSADDTQVQALGIPLNPAQGGGLDFSSFPHYLWSDYRYQLTPSRATFDPRANSGVLSLEPWTSSAIDAGRRELHFTQAYSSEVTGVQHYSVAGTDGRSFAALAGYSAGALKGPAGGLSTRLRVNDSNRVDFHFLGTNVTTKTLGSRSFPTPDGLQKTARGLPVVQWTTQITESRSIQAHAYADLQYLAYDNGLSGLSAYRSRDNGVATGASLAADWDGFRFGAGYRGFDYTQLGQAPVGETIGLVHGSTVMALSSSWSLSPSFQVVSVTRSQGVFPSGALSARFEPEQLPSMGFFASGNYSRRFPTILDRVDVAPFSQGNASLKPERNWTLLVGMDWSRGVFRGDVQAYWQARQDAHALQTNPTTFVYRRVNGGRAELHALLTHLEWDLLPQVTSKAAVTWTGSHLESTQGLFPYLPEFQVSWFLELHDPDRAVWSFDWGLQAETERQITGPSDRLAGFATWEVGQKTRVMSRQASGLDLDVYLRVVDIFNQKPDPLRGYEGAGRSVVFGLIGSL